jgi:D-lactate dehydrogenase (cytochrome)
VFDIMRSGFSPTALEVLTADLVQMLNRDRELGLREEHTLFLEFQGASEVALEEELGAVQDLCQEAGALSFQPGLGIDERNKLWEARYETYESIKHTHPGADPFVADVAVPISRYPEILEYTAEVIRDHGVVGYPFGHAGDGNLHVVFMGDASDEEEWGRIVRANEAIVSRALELGGTCTGEHGVGIGKQPFMEREHGASLGLMRQIKSLLDPQGILNPGKVFP